MIEKMDHLGIAVRDLEAAIQVWRDALGLHLERVEEVPTEKVRTAFLVAGETHVELLQSTDPEGPVARSLEKRGEGIHHVAFAVDDVEAAMARGREAGVVFLSDEPRPGAGGTRVVFAHPRSVHGVLVELVEKPREAHR